MNRRTNGQANKKQTARKHYDSCQSSLAKYFLINPDKTLKILHVAAFSFYVPFAPLSIAK